MDVKRLSSTEEFEHYVDFANEVYRDNPFWVPSDKHHLVKLLGGNAGFGPRSEIQAFTADEDGRTLATVAAVWDQAYDLHWNERMGHLLFFEALPDKDEAVEALISDACEWLRDRGCNAVRISMLPGMQLPLTIDAYACAPSISAPGSLSISTKGKRLF